MLTLARILFILGTLSLSYFAYAGIRAMRGGFGVSVQEIVITGGITLIVMIVLMLLPFVIMGWVCFVRHEYIPKRRVTRGCCPHCGYSLASSSTQCPECGGSRMPGADGRRRSWHVLRRLVLCSLISVGIGSAVGEAGVSFDESLFREEVNSLATPDKMYWRSRAWPSRSYALVYVPGEGIHATQ